MKNLIILLIISYSSYFQSILTHKTIDYLSKKHGLNISIENVYIRLPNKIQFKNIYIEDLKADTLFYSNKLSIRINNLKLLDKNLHINKIDIIKPYLNIYIDAYNNPNYLFLFENFDSDKETDLNINFEIFCKKINVIDARIDFKKHKHPQKDTLFDFSNISATNLNVDICSFFYNSDSIYFNLNNINLTEKSGFNLEKISSNIIINSNSLLLKNLEFKTNQSEIKCTQLLLSKTKDRSVSESLSFNNLNIDLIIDNSYFNWGDLGFFIPKYKNKSDIVYFSGSLNGNLSRLRLKDFNINYGYNTSILANISIDGLPDIDNTFLFGNFKKLNTSYSDIENLTNLVFDAHDINIPSIIEDLGNISFSGNLTGLVNDIVAYGNLKTSIGSARTDIAVVSDFNSNFFEYKGNINVNNLNLAKILKDEKTYGLLTMNAKLNGVVDSLGNFSTTIKCNISEINVLNYKYSNIEINGLASNNFFEGNLNINDSNIKLNLNGYFDNRKKYPDININSELWADLQKLNLVDTIDSDISFNLDAKISGNLTKMPEGYLLINDMVYRNENDSIIMNSFTLNTFYDNNRLQHLNLRSDFLDIDLDGKFNFAELIEKISMLVYNYFPSISDDEYEDEIITDNKANFFIKLKDADKISKVLSPKFHIDKDVLIEGNINTLNNAIEAKIKTKSIKYDSIYFKENIITLKTFPDSIDIKIKTEELYHHKFSLFENINFDINVYKDSVYFNLIWDNFDSIRNSGNIIFSSIFVSRDNSFPLIKNRIFSSKMILQNREWEIFETPVIIDTNSIYIEKFKLSHNNQSLFVDGYISSEPTKLLRYLITDVDVSNINSYISETGYEFDGILSGSGRIANIYETPSIRTSFSINNFKINNEDFGRFDISGFYDADNNDFNIDASNKYMNIKGSYLPKSNYLDFSINIENFNLEVFQPYLYQHDLSKLSGSFNVFLNVDGQINNPNINGYLDFNQAFFVYDFLNMGVLTNDKVLITNNGIILDNFKFSDKYNNSGTINGGLYHNKFENITFDFNINTKNIQILNTSAMDNNQFYGKVFADSNVRIKGSTQNLSVNANAKTKPNTVFVLPMISAYESRDVSFLTFVKDKAEDEAIIAEPLRPKSDFNIRIDIEITPDAEAQIVFDSKAGDIIRGNCQGNINIEYNSDERFYMYGELEVIEGDYLFTLQNVINKRFQIKQGGTIIWSGDPNEAIIDINAVYNLRAPLIDLMRAYEDTSYVYRRPTSVECHMKMTGKLMSPEIQFNIEVPHADEKAKAQLSNLSQDEINRQLLSLLILNRFSPEDLTAGSTTSAFGTTTTTELLSNQLSNWLSQISKDFDIGFNYRPGNEVTGQELELALSTQILNDRVLINGNFGYGENQLSAANNMVGDVEIQYKVNPRGSFRIKGFTRANDELNSELGPYTSGMGVFYTEDFNSWRELGKKIINTITLQNRTRNIQKE